MENKIATSIEQSKKLIELGIDRNTSDMFYYCGEDLRIGGHKAQDDDYDVIDLDNIKQRVEKYEKLLETIKQEMYKMPSIPKALLDSKK